jgi:excisionase family DNA binding protein
LPQPTQPIYLRTAQVAQLLQVSPKTVSRWAQEGMLPYLRTLGGHRRYPDRQIRGPAGNPVRAILGRLAARLA